MFSWSRLISPELPVLAYTLDKCYYQIICPCLPPDSSTLLSISVPEAEIYDIYTDK